MLSLDSIEYTTSAYVLSCVYVLRRNKVSHKFQRFILHVTMCENLWKQMFLAAKTVMRQLYSFLVTT